MNKTKKRWAWSNKNKRKSQSKGKSWYSGGVPGWYCKTFHDSNNTRAKRALKDFLSGRVDDYYYNPKHQDSSAGYSWW